jgi:hypothetical protein
MMWVSFAMEKNKQNGKRLAQLEMHGNELGKKRTTQKIPLTKISLTSANGRQNNK